MKIFCKFLTVNILKLNFCLVICMAKNLIWTSLKAPSDSRFSNSCISAKYCPILTNHTSMESFQMLYKSQFRKIDTYDWFCGPGSHIISLQHQCSIKAGVDCFNLLDRPGYDCPCISVKCLSLVIHMGQRRLCKLTVNH